MREDNQVVHFMWYGTELSKLEMLSLRSFLLQGHTVNLWAYDEIATPLPPEVLVRDAESILPRSRVFFKSSVDPESGVGKGSLGPFSDLFRYKLLYEHGGYWADTDITCLKPLDFDAEYVFRTHRIGMVGNLMKCPPRSRLMKEVYEEAEPAANSECEWLTLVRILANKVQELGLANYIRTDICNADSWNGAIKPMYEGAAPIPEEWYFIHWINEFWRTVTVDGGYYRGVKILDQPPDKNRVPQGSTIEALYRKHGLL